MNPGTFEERIIDRLKVIYGYSPFSESQFKEILAGVRQVKDNISRGKEKWSEKDIILITYGDSIKDPEEKPLRSLHGFLKKYLRDVISRVHILPFFPYSSDDGFSVIDYYSVDPTLGDWKDIAQLGQDFSLMFDLVINHVSQHSEWFRNYLQGKEPGKGYFIEVDPGTDLSTVVRPRSLPLLTEFNTTAGKKYVWTTFSADQVDLNFASPVVLAEMMKVFLFYLSKGARIIRLDAIAFLWKEIGTSCLHLPQTHEVVKLMRDLADEIDPGIILLTETNVPNKENLSYFGKGDEASMVYQFSLPPLLLHALYTAETTYLEEWARSVSDLPSGCTFFNFTASHDGIGVRPLEGLLPPDEILALAEAMKLSGGYVSTRRNPDGTDSPYEMNITYYDALKRTRTGDVTMQFERFIFSQTLMMSFKGIPAFYIHSLLATENYLEGVRETGMPRSINRRKWSSDELYGLLDTGSHHGRILEELTRRIRIRRSVKAFHPDAGQRILPSEEGMFAFSRGENNELLVVANFTATTKKYKLDGFSAGGSKKDLLRNETLSGEDCMLAPYQIQWIGKSP